MSQTDRLTIVMQLARIREFVSGTRQARQGITGIDTATKSFTTTSKKASGGFTAFGRNSKLATRSVGGLRTGVLRAGKALAGMGIAFAGFQAGKRAVNTTVELAKSTIGLSKNFGFANKEAGEWAAMAKVRGISTQQLGMGFKTLSAQVEKARGGSKSAISLFRQLGISQSELMAGQKNLPALLGQVSDGLNKMGPGTDRVNAASTLLGRSWQGLTPLLRDGSKGMKEQLDMANKYGATLGGKPLKNAADYIKLQREMQFAQLGFQIQFTTVVMPALMKFIKAIMWLIKTVRTAPPALRILGASLAAVGLMFAGPAGIITGLIIAGLVIQSQWKNIAGVFNAVKNAVGPLFTQLRAATGLTKRDMDNLTKSASNVWKAIRFIAVTTNRFLLPVMRRALPAIKQLLRGLAMVFGGVFKVITGILSGDWRRAWAGAKQIVRGAIQAIIGIVRGLTAPIREVLSKIPDAFRGALVPVEKMFATLKGAIESVLGPLDGILNKVKDLVGTVSSAPGAAGDLLGKVFGTGGYAPVGTVGIVGDTGPEIMQVGAAGTTITPMASAAASPDFNFNPGGFMVRVNSQTVIDKRVVAETVSDHVAEMEARR